MFKRVLPVAALLFLSGMCALIFQTAWMREFRLFFGATTAASAAVLAIFMGGLGLGNALFGKRADHHPNPLAMYGKLELVIAITAAISPFLIKLVGAIYISLGGQLALGEWPATIARLGLASLVIGVPTLFMGGTLPAACRAAISAEDASRRGVSLLYGLNTFGAVMGAGLSTFYLLETVGTRMTLWIAAFTNLVLASVAIVLANRWAATGESAAESSKQAEDTPRDPADEQDPAPAGQSSSQPEQTPNWLVYGAAGIVGMAFFLMEIVWFRMLTPLLGGTTFTFGIILMIALAGIGLGGAAYAFIYRYSRPTLSQFGLTCALEALFLAIPYALGDRIAILAYLLKSFKVYGFFGEAIGWTIISSIVILPAAFIAGVQFPLLIALIGSGREKIGKQVGYAFAWNTCGAIFGSLLGGFGILWVLSARGTWICIVLVLCGLALAVAATVILQHKKLYRAVLILIPVAGSLACFTALGPTAIWRHSSIGAGRGKPDMTSKNSFKDWLYERRKFLVNEFDGVESSVGILKVSGLSFIVNGKSDGNAVSDAGTQIMLGLMGGLIHPNPQTGLVIGLGTGETTGWLAEVPTMQRVDVVEMEPAITRMAELCSKVNNDVMNNPKVNVIFNDAREVVLTTPHQYDLIISEPSNPYRAGIASLYTKEFYGSVAQKLKPDGMFLQWLQAYEVDYRTIKIVLKTLRSEFEYVEIWQTQLNDMLLICSNKPIEYDVDEIRRRLKLKTFRSGVDHAWHTTMAEGVFAHYVANNKFVESIWRDKTIPENTDDHNYLEYGFARMVGKALGNPMLETRNNAYFQKTMRPEKIRGDLDWELAVDQLVLEHILRGIQILHPGEITNEQNLRYAAVTAFKQGQPEVAVESWEKQPRKPTSKREMTMLGLAYASLGDKKAEELIESIKQRDPLQAKAIEVAWLSKNKKYDQAHEKLIECFLELRENPWPYFMEHLFSTAVVLASQSPEKAKALYQAMGAPFAVFVHESKRLGTIGNVAQFIGSGAEAEYASSIEPWPYWHKNFLEMRYRAYKAEKSPLVEQARKDLLEFYDNEPSSTKRLIQQ